MYFKNMTKRMILLFSLFISFILAFCAFKYLDTNSNEIALNVLQKIKDRTGKSVNIKAIKKNNNSSISHENWSSLLQKHVKPNGQVNYLGFINDHHIFNDYLENLSNHPPGNLWTQEEKMAYWINAYNAFTVKLIIDKFPVESIKDIPGSIPMLNSPWDIKFFKIGGIEFDLYTIEHSILRKQFDEPRIHFAINCASVSCPKLRNEAYIGTELNRQLHDQAMSFINNHSKNLINDKEIKLSKIFLWFQKDFTKRVYLKKYANELNSDVSIDFLGYDWSLNDDSSNGYESPL